MIRIIKNTQKPLYDKRQSKFSDFANPVDEVCKQKLLTLNFYWILNS